MLILFKRFSGEPFMLLDDYLQDHIPFTFMLVYQFPLLHISAEIYCEKDTNICWRWTRCRQEAPPQRGRWRPRHSNTSCVNVSQVCVCVREEGGGGAERQLRGSWKSCLCCKWSPTIPVRRCAELKSARVTTGCQMSSCHHYLDEWKNAFTVG